MNEQISFIKTEKPKKKSDIKEALNIPFSIIKDSATEPIERRFQMTKVIDLVYEFIRPKIAEEQIDPRRDFSDLYNNEVIENDIAEASRLRKRFEQQDSGSEREAYKLSRILEFLLMEGVQLHDWIDGDTNVVPASDYDDIINHIDAILENQPEDGQTTQTAITLDATFSSDLTKKIRTIKKEIESGKLSKVKYFKSPNGDYRGELNRRPRVIIGMGHDKLFELIELWLSNDTKSLQKHPAQVQLLEEIIQQLVIYRKYAEKSAQKDVALIFNNQLLFFKNVLARKLEDPILRSARQKYQNDPFFNSLLEHLRKIDDI